MGDVEGLLQDRPLVLKSTTRKLFSPAKPSKRAAQRMRKKKHELARRNATAATSLNGMI